MEEKIKNLPSSIAKIGKVTMLLVYGSNANQSDIQTTIGNEVSLT